MDKQPKKTLALLQHQINWWSNFNVDHFEKVMGAREFKKEEVKQEDSFIFHSIFNRPNRNVWDNTKFVRFHKI